MDWFKMKKDQEKKEKPEDINSVMAKAEEGEIQVTKVDKIEFIGKKSAPVDSRSLSQRLNGFHVKHWLSKDKIVDQNQYNKLILDEYNKLTKKSVTQLEDVDLSNLNTRFQITKQVQAQSGRLIPDYILTKAINGASLSAYFDKLLHGTPSKEHLSLEQLQISSENVYLEPAVTSRERKSKFKNLLKEASLAQEQKTEKLIQGVRA
jgi:hypothetical protein